MSERVASQAASRSAAESTATLSASAASQKAAISASVQSQSVVSASVASQVSAASQSTQSQSAASASQASQSQLTSASQATSRSVAPGMPSSVVISPVRPASATTIAANTAASATAAAVIHSGQRNRISERMSVSAVKKLGLYRTTNFSQRTRITWYAKEPITRQPQFVIIGVGYSKTGKLRFKVRDVNHDSKTFGLVGYITGNSRYIKPTYYQELPGKKHRVVTIINPQGVDAYKTDRQTGEITHYKQGKVFAVKRIVHYHLTTRLLLTNGHYITANKQWVQWGRVAVPKQVTAKHHTNLYRDVNLRRLAGSHFGRQTKIHVLGWNYATSNRIRYRVTGGYITANHVYVRG